MFDGVPDQFHQFITPRTSLPLHLSFPLHASPPSNTFPPFDPYNPSPHHQLPLHLQPNLFHPLHHHKDEAHKEDSNTAPVSLEIETDQRQLPELVDPWTNDEVLALLRIRSSMESWFPELTWEHVSRKLAELGYKRSADKCKDKFEEESRYFSNINNFGKNNYRFVSELEEVYQGGESARQIEGEDKLMGHALEDGVDEEKDRERPKRKRPGRFEVFKGFCESIVHKMMAQQEEMHNKLLQDMMKRDQEKFAREEAWKKQAMDRVNKELEVMAQEQAIAGDRQANIIQFLKKFSASQSDDEPKPTSSDSPNPNPNTLDPTQLPSSENPSSSSPARALAVASSSHNPGGTNIPKETDSAVLNKGSSNLACNDDVGRRWPKDEVLALINLRCNSVNEDREGNKAPLWERISQGMLELGYKRSAKRCKEKWENINKYFRKTKDANKKRSLDSRTCPYFHQLSNLYNQGKLVLQSENHLNPPPPDHQTQLPESRSPSAAAFSVQVDRGGEKTTSMQVPSLDFDQF